MIQECVCEGEFVWACGPECDCFHHMVPEAIRDEAIWSALLFILAWSNDEVRKLRPFAAVSFLRALEQDGAGWLHGGPKVMWIRRDNDPKRGYEIRESKNGETLGYAKTSVPGVHYDWEAWCDSPFSSFVCGRVGSGHRSRLSAAYRLLEHHEAMHR